MRTEAQRLGDIITAVDAIERFVAGKDDNQFRADDMLQAAVHSKLVIIGESITHLDPATTQLYPEIPWQPRIPQHDHPRLLQNRLANRLGYRHA